MRRRGAGFLVILTAVLMAISLALAGCGKDRETDSTYMIGAVLSLSGTASSLGEPEKKSLDLLEDKINGQGGIDGHKIQFVIEDDESDPLKAGTAMAKLINQEKIAAIIGSSTTGTTLAMAIGNILQYLEDNLEVARIAVLHDANAFGTGGADELEEKAPEHNIQIVARESYQSGDAEMTAQLTRIRQTDAQAVVVWGITTESVAIAKNMQQLNMQIPFIGSHGIANRTFIDLAGEAANGVVFPASRLLIPSSIAEGSQWRKAVDDFSREYRETYGVCIDTFAAHAWDAGIIITKAMEKAGIDRPKLRDQIEKTNNLVGIDGIYVYTPSDHDGLSIDDLIMIKIESLEWTEVESS